jgi:hypothetical protein
MDSLFRVCGGTVSTARPKGPSLVFAHASPVVQPRGTGPSHHLTEAPADGETAGAFKVSAARRGASRDGRPEITARTWRTDRSQGHYVIIVALRYGGRGVRPITD